MIHLPVMLHEAITHLRVIPNEWYVDATLGGGSHTQAILNLGGKVIGLDQDPQAIESVKTRFDSPNLTLVEENFCHLTQVVHQAGLDQVAGILFDLGTSAFQFDTPSRGFSFQTDAPLDMRMSPKLTVTAADLVNALSKKELYVLFTKFAQVERGRLLADHIVRARRLKPITTTTQLAAICIEVYGPRQGKLHPATKVFLALRIAVNDELNNLQTALIQAGQLLIKHGRLVVISFHEGEDRLVKQYLKSNDQKLFHLLTPKPLTPTREEVTHNPRSRSAKLRAASKL